ncbi:MAG: L,D-transpeptidase family protein [Alphaproteobacteria bacterium]|nr:L,D-transpeptidase family protein [Alphaproteobacteria bacterium]
MAQMLSNWVRLLVVLGVLASASCAPPRPPKVEPLPLAADRVIVLKGERRLVLLNQGQEVRSYQIALGRNPVGRKEHKGDGRTPEGTYVLDWRNPRSEFYRSIHISYPNGEDVMRARQRGVSPGGDIMIHGLPNHLAGIDGDHAKWDWTEGCIAVKNEEMDEIWQAVADGTIIEIRP